jgi:AcrR family transcriptional regulator
MNDSTSRTLPGGGANTARRLREVAARLFWTKGYGDTTIREIAEALEIQKASVYYYVDSKETLLFEICLESLENIHSATLEAVSAVDDPVEKLKAMVRAHVAALLKERYKHATMLMALKSLTAERRSKVIALRDDYETLIDSVLLGAIGAGVLRAIPVRELRFGLLNILNWTVLWYNPDDSYDTHYVADSLGDLFLNGALVERTQMRAENFVPHLKKPE